MNSSKAILLVVIIGLLAFSSSGCGHGNTPNTILPLVIANTSIPTAIINKSYSASLTANGGLGPFTWALTSGTLPSGITMSSSGVFSGTSSVKGDSMITVQVTDSQKPIAAVATQALTLTVNNPLSLTTKTIKTGSVNVPYQFVFTATGGASPYTWTILSGTLPDGLQFDGRFAAIFGTPTVEGTFPLTVQVAHAENPPDMMQISATLTVGGSIARLAGNYTFQFRGFKDGKLVLQIGSFVADGTGNITSGTTDIVSSAGVNANVAVTGTYNVDDTGHGTMTLMFGPGGSVGTGTYQLTNSLAGNWAFLQNGDGQATQYGSGSFQVQNTIPTDLTNLKGNWVFGGSGTDSSNNRYAAGGTFVLTPATGSGSGGTIDTGSLDSNDFGTVTNNTAFSGNIAVPDATTGRATMSLASNSVTYYYVDDSDLIAIQTNKVSSSAPLISYKLNKQTTFIPVDNTILNGNGITELTAVSAAAVPETSLGLFSLDGKGNFWTTFDDNTGGTLSQSTPSGTYAVTSTGRTTFTGLPNSPIFYISNTDTGFMLGTDANVTFGQMEQQKPPQQNNQSFNLVNAGGTILGPVVPTQTVEVDIYTADGKGSLTGAYDTSGPNGPMMGLSITATFNVESASCASAGITFNTCGRFPLLDSNSNQIGIGYVASSITPPREVIMTTTPQPVINALQQ